LKVTENQMRADAAVAKSGNGCTQAHIGEPEMAVRQDQGRWKPVSEEESRWDRHSKNAVSVAFLRKWWLKSSDGTY